MAQPMQCDYSGCPNVVSLTGGYIVSEVMTGDTNAWCPEHYVLLCAAIVASAEQAAETQPEPEAPPPDEPTDEDEDQDRAVVARLVPAQPAPEPAPTDTAPGESADSPGAPPSPRVVKRGTSPSRRAYQARTRAQADRKRAAAAKATEGTPEP